MILRRLGDKEQTGRRKLLKSCFSGRGMKYNALIFQQNNVDPYEIYKRIKHGFSYHIIFLKKYQKIIFASNISDFMHN